MKKLLNEVILRKYVRAIILPLITLFMAVSLFAIPAFATGVYEFPNLTPDTWVVDEGDVISRINESKISTSFADLAKQTGNEVRFVTVRRLDYGETPESFSKALLNKWFPEKESQTNQVLMMIDTVSNGIAIITGDKVKSILSDDTAKSVAFETFLAPLRDGDKYNQAFLDASDRLVAILSGQPDPGPPQMADNTQVEGTYRSAEESKKDRGNATAWVVGLLIAATVIPMATYYLYLVNQPSSDS
ncbi:MAG: TPM domain-containing protein [Calothrix sp. C42_A2020_038]|nr:TPM domain-containing protein [Calothrix sp. C42_A2020_038]